MPNNISNEPSQELVMPLKTACHSKYHYKPLCSIRASLIFTFYFFTSKAVIIQKLFQEMRPNWHIYNYFHKHIFTIFNFCCIQIKSLFGSYITIFINIILLFLISLITRSNATMKRSKRELLQITPLPLLVSEILHAISDCSTLS